MDKSQAQARLVAEIDRLAQLRRRPADDADYARRREAFRTWQGGRLARTHADLLASKRFRQAAGFFLEDLYGPRDIGAHVEDVRRAVPLIVGMLPVGAIETVAEAIELAGLSEDLDAAMIDALGPQTGELTNAAYGSAYRAVGRRDARARQIDLIDHLGRSLERLTHLPLIGGALRVMRKPAAVAGFGEIQRFLERGYAAFRTMRGGSTEFVETIVERERAISAALFARDDSALGPEPGDG